jgi:hypothetical protein
MLLTATNVVQLLHFEYLTDALVSTRLADIREQITLLLFIPSSLLSSPETFLNSLYMLLSFSCVTQQSNWGLDRL